MVATSMRLAARWRKDEREGDSRIAFARLDTGVAMKNCRCQVDQILSALYKGLYGGELV